MAGDIKTEDAGVNVPLRYQPSGTAPLQHNSSGHRKTRQGNQPAYIRIVSYENQEQEARQPAKIFYYDTDASCMRTAFRWTHTVVPLTVSRLEFWFFFVCHLAVYFTHDEGKLKADGVLGIDWNDIRVISAMTTIFQVFYTNQVYARYMHMYNSTRGMLGLNVDLILDLRLHLWNAGLCQHARMSARYILASMILFFYEVNGEVSQLEWSELLTKKLVKPEEKSFLDRYQHHERSLIMVSWCGDIFRSGVVKQLRLNTNILNGFMLKLNRARDLQREVMDTLDLPVPFQYFHLLNLMVFVNLFVWAYAMGVTNSIFAPFVYLSCELIFLGMLKLTAELTDPFGPDEVDFPVQEWITELIDNAKVLLEFEYAPSENAWKEPLELEGKLSSEAATVTLFLDSLT